MTIREYPRLYHHQLTKLGYDVTSVSGTSQVLRELLENGHGVVLLDIDMLECSGVELLRQIKRQDAGHHANGAGIHVDDAAIDALGYGGLFLQAVA